MGACSSTTFSSTTSSIVVAIVEVILRNDETGFIFFPSVFFLITEALALVLLLAEDNKTERSRRHFPILTFAVVAFFSVLPFITMVLSSLDLRFRLISLLLFVADIFDGGW